MEFIAKTQTNQQTQPQGQPEGAMPGSTIVFGGLGGRADQAFAQIHQLYMAALKPALDCGDVYLFTPSSVIFILEEGENVIKTPLSCGALDESVGIIPILGPAKITTKGLEWDVEDWHTSFEAEMSTSNHIKADQIMVKASHRVLFTLHLASKT